jgi:hypothetical protein
MRRALLVALLAGLVLVSSAAVSRAHRLKPALVDSSGLGN